MAQKRSNSCDADYDDRSICYLACQLASTSRCRLFSECVCVCVQSLEQTSFSGKLTSRMEKRCDLCAFSLVLHSKYQLVVASYKLKPSSRRRREVDGNWLGCHHDGSGGALAKLTSASVCAHVAVEGADRQEVE